MLLRISSEPSRRKNYPKRTLHLKCDVCFAEFDRKFSQNLSERDFHFCGQDCQHAAQNLGGLLDQKKKALFVKNFGADSPQKSDKIREKTRQTNLKRYGFPVASQSDNVKEKARQSNLKNRGVGWLFQDEDIKQKSKETWVRKYGVTNPMRSKEVKEKYDWKSIVKKQHETKKKNGTYARSKTEDDFYQRLLTLFEDSSICRNVRVDHGSSFWLIDFKVDDLYVHYDGEYWHGLSRPLEEIKKFNTPRDRAILAAYNRDRIQDAWFEEQGMSFVRITDNQEKSMSDGEIKNFFAEQLQSRELGLVDS